MLLESCQPSTEHVYILNSQYHAIHYTYIKNLSVCIIVCVTVVMCRHSYVTVHKWGTEDSQGCQSSSSTLSETGVCCLLLCVPV